MLGLKAKQIRYWTQNKISDRRVGGAEKHEIYAVASVSHLFHDLF